MKARHVLAWMAAGAVAAALTLAFLDHRRESPEVQAPPTPLGAWDTDPRTWGRYFPREYQSWLQARDPDSSDIGHGPGVTKWGRADRVEQDARPLFAGLSSPQDGAPLQHPVSCQVCHDPQTMNLRVSQPGFIAALEDRHIDPLRLSRQELRVYVCAQCHVAIQEEGHPKIPFSLDELVGWTGAKGPENWTHAMSETPLIQLQHPEFQLWSLGGHARRGVSCVDCHMPSVSEGATAITVHRMNSPLLDSFTSCGGCHHWSERETVTRVEAIQDTTMDLQRRAAKALLNAHEAVAWARRQGTGEERLTKAMALIREAQTRWDFIAAEHSTGFHAPQEAAVQLSTALDLAGQAIRLAQPGSSD